MRRNFHVRFLGEDGAGNRPVLTRLLRFAIGRSGKKSDTLFMQLVVRNDHRPGEAPEITLKAHFGPGDHGELVLTIMEVAKD